MMNNPQYEIVPVPYMAGGREMTEAPKQIWIDWQLGTGADFWWPRAADVCPDDGVNYVRAEIADEMLAALKTIMAEAIACQNETLISEESGYLEAIEVLAYEAIAKAEENDQ